MLDRTPHIFISYSWTSDEYQKRVVDLASRLVSNGVDVTIDVWNLKRGQDKYAFMEECVNNQSIDKVLILSDKLYAEKADGRKGGVGNETTIITAKVYNDKKQERFIPVVMERDEKNNVCLPVYLQSRMYEDLSGDNYENGFDSLLRIIYDQPAFRKPELGSPPIWLMEEEAQELYKIKEIVKNIKESPSTELRSITSNDFVDSYIESLKQFYKEGISDDIETFLVYYRKMKEYRDVFLEYLKDLSQYSDFGLIMGDIIEYLYNKLYNVDTFCPGKDSVNKKDFELFQINVWELFLCVTTFMIHYEKYEDLRNILVRTYFLNTSPLGKNVKAFGYNRFRIYSIIFDEDIRVNSSKEIQEKYTVLGHFMVSEREYLPIFSKTEMAQADLFLYQVYNALELGELRDYPWFPTLYIYADRYNSVWLRLKSRQFCKKLFILFDVNDIDSMREKLSKCVCDSRVKYSRGIAFPAQAILDFIELEEIGTLP